MPAHPRPSVPSRFVALAALALAAAGCGGRDADRLVAPAALAPAAPAPAARPARAPGGRVDATARARVGHPWFPLTPGRYADFRIRRLTVDAPSYVRVTCGVPEPFFGRMATPWVFGDVPGRTPDDALHGLRQYFSLAPDGALWFHGAQNNGFMSHTEPPVRQLPALPVAGAAWADTVFFESFFPGGVPFYAADQVYAFTLSGPAFLALPGGPVHALQASVRIDDVNPGGAALALAAFAGESIRSARGDRPALVPERGLWFARQRGLVARDYPHGPGPDVINITTYERVGEGFGPVPAASSAP